MHFKFLTRWIKHLTRQEVVRGGVRLQVACWDSVMVVVFCKKLPQLQEMLLFPREINEPVMVIQAAVFTRNYNCQVVQVFTTLLQNIVHIYGN